MHTTVRTALELVHELWAERPQTCCPCVRHDEEGCWCASPTLTEGAERVDRYLPCNAARLQLWCLTEPQYTRCHFYSVSDVG
jgi:hypothetical protein